MSFTEIGTNHFLVLAAILFAIGSTGVLVRRNVIVLLMSVEIMLNAVNLTMIAFARSRPEQIPAGHIFSFFIMAVAAAEVAVGLAMVISIFRLRETTFADELDTQRE
jgi:NADH-quinone oxidoreductase subunit K